MMTVYLCNIQCVLLDIEGTVADVRFVYDVMFPYAKEHLPSFLQREWSTPHVRSALQQVAKDNACEIDTWLGKDWQLGSTDAIYTVNTHLQKLMSGDSKATGLKSLQGMVWKEGFESGAMRAELFDDVLPALRTWKEKDIQLRIYSSGSVQAQKLFFGHTTQGNLLDLFSGFYDTQVGKKQEPTSYSQIASDCDLAPSKILFVSDIAEELIAAQSARMQVVASIRRNNKPLSDSYLGSQVCSFSEISIDN